MRVLGFTEHNMQDLLDTRSNYLFRCHPSYRCGNDSEFQSTVWYDWAVFDLEDDGAIPCQILCFVNFIELKVPYESVAGFLIDSPGTYAIVRRFEESPSACAESKFTKEGMLHNRLFLFSTDNIICEAAVVPNLMTNGNLDRRFFLVSNRETWLEQFYSTMERVNNKAYVELYGSNMVD